MKMIRIGRFCVHVCVVIALAACGGGGSGGGSSQSGTASVTVSGWVLLGPVSGATVQLLSVASDGSTQVIDQATTAADGSYSFHATPASGAVFMVSASGGTYPDEATATSRSLSVPLRALQVWSGAPVRVNVTPYSEAVARAIAQATSPDWSASNINAVSSNFAYWLGADTLTDFQPIDLESPMTTAPAAADVEGSLLAGTFSEFAHGLDPNPDTSLATGLDSMAYLLGVDQQDDRIFPAFVAAMVNFTNLTALPDTSKSTIESEILFLSPGPMTAAALAQGMPTGTSSGGGTAPMADDAFQMIDVPRATMHFNKRGALVEYTDPSQALPSTSIYTASVAEVFAEGDVGIGRWNGGTVLRASSLGASDATIGNMTYPAFQYGVAKAPASIPACGRRQLALVASTMPSLHSNDSGAQRVYTGITSDSTVGVQYLAGVYVGVDIGLQMADGSVVRFQSLGGPSQPWLTGLPPSVQPLVLTPSTSDALLANANLTFEPLVGGAAANKVVAHLSLPYINNDTEMEAVFIDSAASADTSACGQTGNAGPGLTSLPSDGQQFVFLDLDNDTTYLGAPVNATFGSAGQLQTVSGTFSLSGPFFDLAGNSSASIGRVLVTDTLANKTRTEPYAIVLPGTMTTPSTGTYTYDLVASTAPVPELGDANGGVLPGSVSAATLTVTFGQNPVGTPSPYYGTVQLFVQGSIGGQTFALSSDNTVNGQPVSATLYGQDFSSSKFNGALSAPGGNFLALTYSSSAGAAPINGSLLFKLHGT